MEIKDLQDLLKFKDFKFRGREKEGIDCFGFFLKCSKILGKSIPDYFYNEKNAARLLLKEYHKYFKKVDKPQYGDAILLHGDEIHIGVYLGNDRFIHLCREFGARIDYLHQKPWVDQIYGYFRYIEPNG